MDENSSYHGPDIPTFETQLPAAVSTSTAPKRLRACVGCREQKLRCELSEQNPQSGCGRCLRTGRQCIVPPAPSHRPRNSGENRVEVLGKRLDALVATLAERKKGSESDENEKEPRSNAGHSFEAEALSSTSRGSVEDPTANSTQSGPHFASPSVRKEGNGKRSRIDDYNPFSFFMPKASRKDELFKKDVISRGHLSLADAERVYHRFLHRMLPHLPIIVLPQQTAVNDLRRTKPTLFLAILSVASGILGKETKDMLARESMSLLADRLIIRGEKDLDLVQALQISVIWYHAPEQYQEVKLYQLLHIAATMAIDLGYGEPYRPTLSKLSSLGFAPINAPFNSVGQSVDTVEERQRALLCCYFLCGYASMTTRRPAMLRWIPYLETCIASLTDTPNALESDKILCQWVRGQHIAEDIGINFSMDDPSENFDGSDIRLQYILAGFEQQLERWRSQIPPELHNHLQSYISTINLYLHEIVLHVGHNIHDFRPPFLDETLISTSSSDTPQTPSLMQLNSIASCIVSAQSVLDIFLGYNTETICSLPVFFFARTAYAAFALVRIHQMASQPDGRFSMIDKESLKIEAYIQHVLHSLRGVIEGKNMRIASAFHLVLQMMALWLQRQSQATAKASSGERTLPLHPLITPRSNSHQVEQAPNQNHMFTRVNNPGTGSQSVMPSIPDEFGILDPGSESVQLDTEADDFLETDFSALFNSDDGRFFETALQWFGV